MFGAGRGVGASDKGLVEGSNAEGTGVHRRAY